MPRVSERPVCRVLAVAATDSRIDAIDEGRGIERFARYL